MTTEESFSRWCRDLVIVNFRQAVADADGEWLPLMVGGSSSHERTYMELQPVIEEHGKDDVLETWAPIQVQVEGWTEAALLMTVWIAPIRDDGLPPSEDPERRESVCVIAFVRGQHPEAYRAPIIRAEGRPPRLGRWFQMRGPLEGKGFDAMQAAVDGDLLLPYVEMEELSQA